MKSIVANTFLNLSKVNMLMSGLFLYRPMYVHTKIAILFKKYGVAI
jgi:hypothetical protein